MKVHFFDTEVAAKVGVEAAVIFQNLVFWIEKNEANQRHFHDGSYWTYNSNKAFTEIFPYMSVMGIRTAITKLIDGGYVRTGNFNKDPWNRTLWYALTERGLGLAGKAAPSAPSEEEETTNAFVENNKSSFVENNKCTITDINNTDINVSAVSDETAGASKTSPPKNLEGGNAATSSRPEGEKPAKKSRQQSADKPAFPECDYRAVFDAYTERVRALTGHDPLINWGRARAQVKALFASGLTPDDFKRMFARMEGDKWLASHGYDFHKVCGAAQGLLHGAATSSRGGGRPGVSDDRGEVDWDAEREKYEAEQAARRRTEES